MTVADESGTQKYYRNNYFRNDRDPRGMTPQAGSSSTTRTANSQNAAWRRQADSDASRLTGGYQPNYGPNPTFDQIMAADLERQVAAGKQFWANRSGESVWMRTDDDGNSYRDVMPYNNDPAFNPELNLPPYPTTTNPGGGGGGGSYYGGGQSEAERQAAWEKYQKDYLAMVAGFRPTEVGPAPIDDLTPLVNQAVDADVAHVAAAYGDVVPMDANAYQTTSRATTPSAAMYGGGLMDGQGFDAASARQNQIRRQGELNADAHLWDQHWAGEDARTEQFNSARNADVATLGANAEALVEAQRASLLAAAGVKYQDEMDGYEREQAAARNADARRKEEAAMALLQQALASGLDISGLDLSAFVGGA